MNIHIHHTNGLARRGQIQTAHGDIQTPFFMTIATAAAVKGIELSEVKELGGEIVLSNTYHLHLRPGEAIVKQAGGLHAFMNWDGPILTDSGGFQVFSLAKIRKISEEGVTFNSHIDGREIFLSPEKSMQIQIDLGADIIMAFDDCKTTTDKADVSKSMEITTAWEKRSQEYVRASGSQQQLFGIVQGATYADLRAAHAQELVKIGFDGYAIGGLSVGESEEEMYAMTEAVIPHLPEDQPRYLMGVGTPVNLVESVARGIDMFDCVLPTRNARHGHLYTSQGIVNIRNEQWKADFSPLDPNCSCSTCAKYTKAYLRHLMAAQEPLIIPLLVRHNVAYYLDLMRKLRESIEQESFELLRQEIRHTYSL
ncbi:MAG: tRNA guanosine(34) transglycosylase Tgt [bacterium]|nr:tRNA guanosine(34) transglycosylase Tgt [bacterium]